MARRGGGFPGMGGGMNPQQMMMKVQKMQQQMAQAQEEIANTEITASAGGGMAVSYTHLDVYKRQPQLRAHLAQHHLRRAGPLAQ